MGSKYVIREVDGFDDETMDILTDLHRATLPDAPLADFADGDWWIAYDGKKPVGFAGLQASKRFTETGYLVRAGVLPEARGAGLQKRLIRVRTRRAKVLGYVACISDTTDAPASANSLIACGFKVYVPSKPWAFNNTIYWRKWL